MIRPLRQFSAFVFTIIIAVLLSLVPFLVFGEIITDTHTVKQIFGGSQSPDSAKNAAAERAKREALEKAGTYVENIATVKDFRLEKEDIITLTAGIVKLEQLSEETFLEGTASFGIKIVYKITIDTSILEERIKKFLAEKSNIQESKPAPIENRESECGNVKPETEALGIFDWFHRLWARWKDSKFSDRTRLIERLDRDVQLRPNDSTVYVNRGLAHLRMGNSACGCSDLVKACSLGSCKEYEKAKADMNCR